MSFPFRQMGAIIDSTKGNYKQFILIPLEDNNDISTIFTEMQV